MLPRVLAGVGSGVGALVVFGGAVYSAVRFARRRAPGTGPLAGGNALIALGTLVLSSGGLLQGVDRPGRGVRDLARGRDRRGLRGLRRRVVDVAVCAGRSADDELAADELARERARQRVDDLDARRQLVARELAARVPQRARPGRARARHAARRTRRPSRPCAGAARRSTATSSTSRWLRNASSTSPGNTLKPETMTTSLARSTSVSQPSASATAMSPVCSQPSTSTARGRRGVVPVAREDVRRRARRSRRDRLRARDCRRGRAAGPRRPGSGGPIDPGRGSGVDRGRRDDGRRLGEAVAVVDGDAEPFAHRGGGRRRAASVAPETHRRTCANAVARRGRVVERRATRRRSRGRRRRR